MKGGLYDRKTQGESAPLRMLNSSATIACVHLANSKLAVGTESSVYLKTRATNSLAHSYCTFGVGGTSVGLCHVCKGD